jgi:Zn-dependent protease with chaperone function
VSVAARFYDGQTSQRREVRLATDGVRLIARGEGIERAGTLAELEVSERLGSAPRRVRFADGAFCEVRDHDGFDALLAALGHRASPVERWQRSLRFALASAVGIAALLVAAYVRGLPWAAERLAERLPPAVAETLSQHTLESLERGLLQPSALPAGRRTRLRDGFAALARRAGAPPIDLRFNASAIGANAFALPNGTVVLLDALAERCSDDQVFAVLGHELGHVEHRHGVRLLLQGSLVGIAAAWWFGDLSGLLAAAPAALLQSRYSRDFEAEADAYAVRLLKANGLSPGLLADALEELARAHGERADERHWIDYVSSHPATGERLQALRAQ